MTDLERSAETPTLQLQWYTNYFQSGGWTLDNLFNAAKSELLSILF